VAVPEAQANHFEQLAQRVAASRHLAEGRRKTMPSKKATKKLKHGKKVQPKRTLTATYNKGTVVAT
jgi:hypothetical protein